MNQFARISGWLRPKIKFIKEGDAFHCGGWLYVMLRDFLAMFVAWKAHDDDHDDEYQVN